VLIDIILKVCWQLESLFAPNLATVSQRRFKMNEDEFGTRKDGEDMQPIQGAGGP
jgi:hypothetical protein